MGHCQPADPGTCILSVVIKISKKKGRAPRSHEVLCMCCLYRQVLHVTVDLLLAGPVLLCLLDILGKSSAALSAGGTMVISTSW